MKALLTAIKAQLQTDLTYVRDQDVVVVEDDYLIPKAVKSPAVGLKDGPVIRKELLSGMMEYTMTVKIILYVQLLKDEAVIMGDGSLKGILDMEADVHESLDENLLGITGMQSALALPNQPESELFGDEESGRAWQRKVVSYEYIKEEERPSGA